MITITPKQRRELRAQAHALHPVVSIGQQGLTPQVLHEIDVALRAHALIKVRVFSEDRTERDALLARIADELEAAPVQHLGKVLILWRPPEEEPAKAPERRARKSRARAPSKATAPRGRGAPDDRTPASGRRRPGGNPPADVRGGEAPGSRRRRGRTSITAAGDAAPGRDAQQKGATKRRTSTPAAGDAAPRSSAVSTRRRAESLPADTRAPRGKSAPNPRRRRRAS